MVIRTTDLPGVNALLNTRTATPPASSHASRGADPLGAAQSLVADFLGDTPPIGSDISPDARGLNVSQHCDRVLGHLLGHLSGESQGQP